MKLDRIIAVRNNKTVYRDGDLCMKVFSSDFSKGDILNEALNQARVEETALMIPKIKEVTTIEGKWAIVYSYIKGKTLAQLMHEEPQKKSEYLERFVDLQLTVHAQCCPLLHNLADKMRHRINRADLDEATRTALLHNLSNMPSGSKLCHGDFAPANIIIDESETPYILDWSHATQGNPAADAARTYLLFCLHQNRETAAEYLSLFCKKNKTEAAQIQAWIPLVAAAQSVKGNEKERAFYMAAIHAE